MDAQEATVLTLTPSGAVGIGTTTPRARLEIGAGTLLYSANAYNNLLVRESDDDVTLDFVKKDNTTSSGHLRFGGYAAPEQPYSSLSVYTRAVEDGPDAGLSPRLVVDEENGHVAIGKASATAPLDVAGPIKEQGELLSERYLRRFSFSLPNDTEWHRLARILNSDFAIISSSHNAHPNVYLVAYSRYPAEVGDVQPAVSVIGGFKYPASEVEFRRTVDGDDYFLEIRGLLAHDKYVTVSGHGLERL